MCWNSDHLIFLKKLLHHSMNILYIAISSISIKDREIGAIKKFRYNNGECNIWYVMRLKSMGQQQLLEIVCGNWSERRYVATTISYSQKSRKRLIWNLITSIPVKLVLKYLSIFITYICVFLRFCLSFSLYIFSFYFYILFLWLINFISPFASYQMNNNIKN